MTSARFRVLDRVSGLHESGTKYYELALIQEIDSSGTFVGGIRLIRRYGKISVGTLGGATMIESAGFAEFANLQRSKDRNGYSFKKKFYAGSRLNREERATNDLSKLEARAILSHYRNTSKFHDIAVFLNGSNPPAFASDEDQAMAVLKAQDLNVKPAPIAKPEVVRPENWGTW